jgi:hypothetical protein
MAKPPLKIEGVGKRPLKAFVGGQPPLKVEGLHGHSLKAFESGQVK